MARKYAYKVEVFECTFMGKDKFSSKLEEILNKADEDGWELHSFETTENGGICTVILRKDANTAILEKY